MKNDSDLFKKYDIPAPRYTSYPTVPYWSEAPTVQSWFTSLKQHLTPRTAKYSVYVHVPFCETLCTFCGCNNTITKNHQVENPYVARILREKCHYFAEVPDFQNRTLSQLHLGGGSPTFLSEEHLKTMIQGLLEQTHRESDFEGSVEVDPRRTRLTQLEVLREFGFNRISLGVQDFDPEVQRLIHRQQSFEQTALITNGSRALGYTSINFDLIYGLPKQNQTTIQTMVEKTLELSPDRIALYSFALVPWIKPGQRLFKDEDLPVGAEKRELYETARGLLLKNGYIEIGMDHFAKPTEALALARQSGKLHRNFMGYTDVKTDVLLGLGVSAISESPDHFYQNEKVLPKYESLIDEKGHAPFRGHVLSSEDQWVRKQILELMTEGTTSIANDADAGLILERIQELVEDGLVDVTKTHVSIRPEGRPFLRNLCLAFDRRYFSKAPPQTRIFSSAL